MTYYAVHDANGVLISVGSIVVDPLPVGLTAVELQASDADGLRDGTRRWNSVSRLVEVKPLGVAETLAERAVLIFAEAASATATLQAQRDTAQISFTTIAQAQTAVRGLQSAVQAQAQIQQGVIKRLVAAVRLETGQCDSLDGT